MRLYEGRSWYVLECGCNNLHTSIYERAWTPQQVAEEYFAPQFEGNRWALLTGEGPDHPILDVNFHPLKLSSRFFIAATSMKAAAAIWHALNPEAEPAYTHYTTSVNFIEHGE